MVLLIKPHNFQSATDSESEKKKKLEQVILSRSIGGKQLNPSIRDRKVSKSSSATSLMKLNVVFYLPSFCKLCLFFVQNAVSDTHHLLFVLLD